MAKEPNASGATGRIPLDVPRQRKGRPWAIEAYRVHIYAERDNVGAATRFAKALRASYTAMHKRWLARPTPAPFKGKVKPRKPTYPASPMHRHSKRCLEAITTFHGDNNGGHREAVSPGWFKCKKVGYPYLPLHTHRTKRGRAYLYAHLPEATCPYTVLEVAA